METEITPHTGICTVDFFINEMETEITPHTGITIIKYGSKSTHAKIWNLIYHKNKIIGF